MTLKELRERIEKLPRYHQVGEFYSIDKSPVMTVEYNAVAILLDQVIKAEAEGGPRMNYPSKELLHLVHEINKELLMGEAGWRMDKCAAMIEEYYKADRAAIIQECKAAILRVTSLDAIIVGKALDALKEAHE